MSEHLGFVVVTFNQASHQPELDYSDLHADLESAKWERDDKRVRTMQAGRRERHVVAEVVELDDSDGAVTS